MYFLKASIRNSNLIFALAVLAWPLTVLKAEDAFNISTVAFAGMEAPGIPGAVTYGAISLPAINNSGEVVFTATLAGAEVTDENNRALYAGPVHDLQLIARKGDQPPGLVGDVVLFEFFQATIDDSGAVMFRATLEGTGIDATNNEALFVWMDGTLHLVALKSESPSELPAGITISSILGFAFSGEYAFLGELDGIGVNETNNKAIFKGAPGSRELVTRLGEPAPGMPPGTNLNGLSGVQITDGGNLCFSAEFSSGGQAIYTDFGGTLQPVVKTGDVAVGAPLGFSLFSILQTQPITNNAGHIGFIGRLVDAGGNLVFGVFKYDEGGLQAVVLEGDVVPSPGVTTNFELALEALIDGASNVIFTAILDGVAVNPSNQTAAFTFVENQLELIFRQGQPAPGTDVDFGDAPINVRFSTNESGDMAIWSRLSNDDFAIYYWSNSEMTLIAKENELFDVDDDPAIEDLRMIDEFQPPLSSGGQHGSKRSMNNAGQIVFNAFFDDSTSGLFLATPALIPGDVNGDGLVDLLDIAPLVHALTSGVYLPAADINGDGSVDLLDVAPFIDLLTGA